MLANSTFLLTRLSFFSVNRTSFHHSLCSPLVISLNSSHNLSTPWIVNSFSQSQAKLRSMQSVADGGTEKKSARKAVIVKKEKKTVAEPRYSKAARRYYNERFGEKPQRLAKVLAAAGAFEILAKPSI
ncbi:putative ribosomal large subunit pseudouridine synthase SVR1 chloroplastic [Bienertia sinuspersici]